MNEESPRRAQTAVPPIARVRRSRRDISWVWAIPVVTVLVALYLGWTSLSQRGPTVRISFVSGEGLVAGQTRIRHKSVDMGTVDHLELSPDLSRVIAVASMSNDSKRLLTDKAQFWVVRPRIFAGTISGLGTLLSGSYIELSPAQPGGHPQRDFVGLENPPLLQADAPGRSFLLRAQRIGSISVGSPVFFRDFEVGQVLGWDVGEMAEFVTIHAFVRAPYDHYVHQNTRFWNASGASVQLSGAGLQLQIQSLKALALGGVAFDTPTDEPGHPESGERDTFYLFADKEAADASAFGPQIDLVAYFNQSVAGLAPGSPVTLRGIKIGRVTNVGLKYDAAADNVVAPVYFQVQPDRVADTIVHAGAADTDRQMRDLVGRGLRAQLASTSLITGGMAVTLDVYPGARHVDMEKEGAIFVIPTLPGGSQDLMQAAAQLMAKVNSIPFTEIGQSLQVSLEGIGKLTNGPELRASLQSMQQTLAATQEVVRHLDQGLQPALKRLPDIAANLDQTVSRANQLVGSINKGYGGDSELKRSLERLLGQFNDAARSVRVLADLLTRHPEALIRGRND